MQAFVERVENGYIVVEQSSKNASVFTDISDALNRVSEIVDAPQETADVCEESVPCDDSVEEVAEEAPQA